MLQVQVEPDRSAEYVSLDHVMAATSEALDVGILQFSDAVMTARAATSTPRTSTSRSGTSRRCWARGPGSREAVGAEGYQVAAAPTSGHDVDHQPLIGDAVINDGPGLLMLVEKFPWANTLDVTRGVEAALDEMRPGLPGIEIDTTIFRPADLHRAGDPQPDRRAADRLRCSWSSSSSPSCSSGARPSSAWSRSRCR